MNVLLTGASGFIGRYLLAALVSAGHRVVPAVRRPVETDRLLPSAGSIAVDLNRDVRPEDWIARLAGIDAVINCAGVLQHRPGQSLEAVHAAGPKALFEACRRTGVRRVIQISAISAEDAAGTAYASTKKDADSFLASMELDWVILRPSLVYAEGASGGMALFRALAALPFAVPMVGKGEQVFQPIHVDDLAKTVLRILDRPTIRRVTIDPVGPDRLTLRQILVDLRRWLGIPSACVIEVPDPIIRLAAAIGDVLGGPINSTSLRQLEFGNAGPPAPFVAATGIEPRRWNDALLARPAQPQDRWHARLYFLRPLLRWSLAVLWIGSGLIGILQPTSFAQAIFANLGLSPTVGPVAVWATCLVDVAIGVLVLSARRSSWVTCVQLALVAGYTVCLTLAQPMLWLDPVGPLLKNVPIVVAIVVLAAVEADR